MSTPSWKWLQRSNARELTARAEPAGASPRPCLPAVEALGDRILLSAVAPAAASSDGPPPADQILIGLIKGELKLATSELAALQLVGGEDPQWWVQLPLTSSEATQLTRKDARVTESDLAGLAAGKRSLITGFPKGGVETCAWGTGLSIGWHD